MIFLSWAAGDAGKLATIQALYDGRVTLVMSQESIDEIRDVLNRVEVKAKLSLTPGRIEMIIEETLRLSEWIHNVPKVFTWPPPSG
jgi:predicted nucleic acid-binding protein